jgi:replicative DNA helicase
MIERLYNIDAEQAVLGTILIDYQNFDICLKAIKSSEYFYLAAHQKLYGVFLEMFHLNEPIDIITVTNCVQNKNELDDIGGVSYLSDLINSVPTAASIA